MLAYQSTHDDLVDDGIAGPATRASLSRDIAARKRVAEIGAGSLAVGGTAGIAAEGDPLLVGVAVGLVVLLLAGGFFAWRYRGELRRFLRTIRGV